MHEGVTPWPLSARFLGKYPPGSSEEDKSTLFQALRTLGRDAAGIIPSGMEILFEVPPASTTDLAGELVRRCEMGMSKAILGGTLTSQADGKTSTNALGQVHEEVRLDLLVSDAMQISNTLTQQLIKPLAYLNLGIKDTSLLPYFRFDTTKAEDMGVYAEALPKLAPIMNISAKWVHEKLKIPMALNKNDILGKNLRMPAVELGEKPEPRPEFSKAQAVGSLNTLLALAKDSIKSSKASELDKLELSAGQEALDAIPDPDLELHAAMTQILEPIMADLKDGLEPEALLIKLNSMYPKLDSRSLVDLLAKAFFVADLWGEATAAKDMEG